ncbi:dTDP-4-dehydrorhamnose reductase [Ligilactobacillus animalis]|uniref:dTDP-4-dehydrorhamnose reductase n=4 Tax=Ligilactobacillus animalis TaxID=1605 RepID=A0ABR4RSL6_9LACO|nr:dTDP-4-dehydrorhamnose reductase [Ligilactobacillus animalis]KDA46845.1 dTDP-4-dehydrorhamnose reductase, rfbD [Ligilactobacillus animalis]MDQ2233303.1 dTDP-4-dehydrorhamnose reductase [Ligilactobacillus animalis]MEE0260289.1 dTDP-4-dehydrorhamnose reductase [Ligilactobacillus animalis]PNQ53298.1 dTDP-4-dehydrorhamnose reductase [Ligilactobacillus animalis]QCQ03248.1 dTDP-4-dehydrorhamnose reductase [Ligilactobacillus animalis]
MKILITGGNGQLGQELQHLLDERGIAYDAADVDVLDITDEAKVDTYFAKNRPEVVYHCAAYTAVDKAEGEGKKVNELVNAVGSEIMAKACQKYDALMVYVSTDYVFDGSRTEGEYMPDDPKGPRNEYGRTKLLGEQAVEKYCDKYYIVRTAWVYGKWGHNFVYTMLNLAKNHDRLTVVSDQIGRPTWTRTLAEFLTYLVDNKIDYGVYQCSNDGQCSWYEFATEILKDKDVEVAPVSSDEYPTAAFRPHYSVMHLAKETGFEFPMWQDALAEFMKQIEE